MHIFPAPIDIAEEEGFVHEKDIFQRGDFGEGLVNLVSKSEDPLVILLDSPWGTGKTTFIKMWAGELRKRGFPVVHFDAFENDHVDNAFVAISAEIIRLSQSLKKTKSPAYKKFVKRAGRFGGILLRTSARIGVKAATLGAIDFADIEALKSVANDVAKEASTKADDYVESILMLQSQEKSSLESLRDALANLAGDLKEERTDEIKPLIFIIDELDRCKPTFALELLERIKHVFSVPNVHFLLAAQLGQLENSVRFSYGADIDALTYLQKFYNVVVHFPPSSSSRHERHIAKFVGHLRQSMSLGEDDMAIVTYVAELRGLSFRTIERIATSLALARAFVPANYLWIPSIISVLCIMKIIAPDLFQRARERQLAAEDITKLLGTDKQQPNYVGLNTDWVLGWWRYCLSTADLDRSDPEVQPFRQYLFRYSIDREYIVPAMARYLDVFQAPK